MQAPLEFSVKNNRTGKGKSAAKLSLAPRVTAGPCHHGFMVLRAAETALPQLRCGHALFPAGSLWATLVSPHEINARVHGQ